MITTSPTLAEMRDAEIDGLTRSRDKWRAIAEAKEQECKAATMEIVALRVVVAEIALTTRQKFASMIDAFNTLADHQAVCRTPRRVCATCARLKGRLLHARNAALEELTPQPQEASSL